MQFGIHRILCRELPWFYRQFDKDQAESLVRIRDVVKKMAFGVEFVVFGIESQQNIHYAMPLRAMLYDGMASVPERYDGGDAGRNQEDILRL